MIQVEELTLQYPGGKGIRGGVLPGGGGAGDRLSRPKRRRQDHYHPLSAGVFQAGRRALLHRRYGLLAAGPEYPEASGLPPRRDRLSGWDDRPAVSKIPVPDAGDQGGRPAERNRSVHKTSLGKQ